MLTITDSAVVKLKKIQVQQDADGKMLRLLVVGGGCSGFSYDMEFEDEADAKDKVTDYSGLNVVIDPVSAGFLDGVTLDYTDNLMSAGFHFKNPSATATCGCGTSFAVG
jgi:iron-sulfur cluster assembly accessory protein